MAAYLMRRMLMGLLTLWLITFVVFGLIRNMPGTPLQLEGENLDQKIDPADIERMKKNYGLDLPWHKAYVVWLGNVLRLDLGRSFSQRQPVLKLIGERVGPTLLISLSSLVLTYLLSIPLGLYCSAKSGKPSERAVGTLLYMLYSLPAFVAALLLLMLLSYRMDWFPLRGMKSDNYNQLGNWQQFKDVVWHAVLPIVCATYGSLAYYTRFVRANLQEVVRQDYIRTARAKGAGPLRVLVLHAFRNTLIPLVTLIGLTMPYLISGSIILEQVFDWPGMGRMYFESISTRDYPLIMGLTLLFSVVALLGQLVADVLYAVVDPRVSYA
ncbi:MAG: ABC transporter permease [Planctomycetaceae bacterium]|jgi:peptide/nickel transport system permease protein